MRIAWMLHTVVPLLPWVVFDFRQAAFVAGNLMCMISSAEVVISKDDQQLTCAQAALLGSPIAPEAVAVDTASVSCAPSAAQ